MQPYQTYFPQMNNGYGQQMTMQNPYQQRMDFLQNYQQNLQQPLQPAQIPGANQQMQMPIGLNGKIVSSVEAITANDVPMDGSVAVFPKQDMTEIYIKFWENNGTIRTIVFKPFLDQNPNNSPQTEEKLKLGISEDFTNMVLEKLDGLDNRINELLLQSSVKPMNKSMVSKVKKEGETG